MNPVKVIQAAWVNPGLSMVFLCFSFLWLSWVTFVPYLLNGRWTQNNIQNQSVENEHNREP